VTVNPARFRSDEARMQVMTRIAGILGDLEMAVRRELGADQIPAEGRAIRWHHGIAPHLSVAARPLPAPQRPAIDALREVHLHFHGVTAEDVATILADVTGRAGSA